MSNSIFPDYSNSTLINAMISLIKEMARVYDGDKRIGFLQSKFQFIENNFMKKLGFLVTGENGIVLQLIIIFQMQPFKI